MKRPIFKALLLFFFLNSAFTPTFAEEAVKEKVDINFYNNIKHVASQVYIDEVSEESFIYDSLNGGLSGLDPHSGYLKPEEYAKFKESMSGEFSGVGIQITPESGFIRVITPIDDTPAFKAGIKAGDYITHINGENTYQMSIEEASSKMRGKEGTKVKLVLLRAGADEPLELEIKREKIKNKSVSAKEFDKIQIVRISSFASSTAAELKTVLQNAKNVKGIVLDLRNNPGGILEQSVMVSNFFLNENQVIVSVKSRNPNPQEKKALKIECKKSDEICEEVFFEQKGVEAFFVSKNKPVVKESIPVVVLINSASASASEIVAGALKDNKRAIIVGEVSFGKGVVQSILPINNGENGAMKITISRYYSPSGASIQTVGITPHITALAGKIEVKETKMQSLFFQRESDLKNHTTGERLEEVARQSAKYQTAKDEIQAYYDDNQLLTGINIIQAISLDIKSK